MDGRRKTVQLTNRKKISFKNIDLRKPLPPAMVIKSAGSDLYRIGLSLYSSSGHKSRPLMYHPMIIFLLLNIIIIKSYYSLYAKTMSANTAVMIGDFAYFLQIHNHGNLFIIFGYQLVSISQLLHLYNYYIGVKPTYMKPFDMLSGAVSPESIGLADSAGMFKLFRKANSLLSIFKFMPYTVIPWSLVTFTILSLHCTPLQAITFALPWAVVYYVSGCHCLNILMCQLVYFLILCYYLKLKLKKVNWILKLMTRDESMLEKWKVHAITGTLNSIYREISDYDGNYWSKFLFWFFGLFMIEITTMFFFIVHGSIRFFAKLLFIYSFVLFITVMLYFLNTASAIYLEVNKSYNYLNTVLIPRDKIKFPFTLSFKLLSLIERIGKKRIGFHCWKLFIINYFRFYQIISLMVMYFIKSSQYQIKIL